MEDLVIPSVERPAAPAAATGPSTPVQESTPVPAQPKPAEPPKPAEAPKPLEQPPAPANTPAEDPFGSAPAAKPPAPEEDPFGSAPAAKPAAVEEDPFGSAPAEKPAAAEEDPFGSAPAAKPADVEALQRVLEYALKEGVGSLVCLGDIVGYGPFPNECAELVRQHCSIVIKGNHDAGAVGTISSGEFNKEGRAAIEWTRAQLTLENREFLRNLPLFVTSVDVTFVHASPKDPERWEYVSTWQHSAGAFDHFGTTFCCIGHTHIPGIVSPDGKVNGYQKGKRHIINCGSVGQPRDGDPRASFVLLDTDKDIASIIRVPYDIDVTAQAILSANLPEFLAKRLSFGI